MLEDSPIIIPEAAYYFTAFKHLSTSRDRVESCYLPIKITEIESYCRLVGEKDPLELMSIVKPLDVQFLEFYNEG